MLSSGTVPSLVRGMALSASLSSLAAGPAVWAFAQSVHVSFDCIPAAPGRALASPDSREVPQGLTQEVEAHLQQVGTRVYVWRKGAIVAASTGAWRKAQVRSVLLLLFWSILLLLLAAAAAAAAVRGVALNRRPKAYATRWPATRWRATRWPFLILYIKNVFDY